MIPIDSPVAITRGVGKVWLVGAGPGDAELLTLKAYRVLLNADVWLVDDLVGEDILALAPTRVRLIAVGKRGGCPSTDQAFILRLMARYARSGLQVARVKGGDPFIFGRGGEELAWLHGQGIAAEAVAGLTAGLAAASALGLPLTHREVARGVAFVTAHTADGSMPDWAALADSGVTVVCYMGMGRNEQLRQHMLASGFAPDLPVAVVERVSCRDERSLLTTLADMSADIGKAGLGSPALLIVGRAVAHRSVPMPAQRIGDLPGQMRETSVHAATRPVRKADESTCGGQSMPATA